MKKKVLMSIAVVVIVMLAQLNFNTTATVPSEQIVNLEQLIQRSEADGEYCRAGDTWCLNPWFGYIYPYWQIY